MSEKMREEFEDAYSSYCERLGWKTYTAFHMLSEIYVKESTELAWQMWQASRESLVIELPYDSDGLNPDHSFVKGWRCGVEETRAAIEAAGVKVKP